jgi:ADP-heptose:LPS heptosyltransferase
MAGWNCRSQGVGAVNVDSIRRTDRLCGIPLCALFTAFRSVADLLRKRTPSPVQRVLIIKLSEMGSTVLAYPALCELRRRVPDVDVYVLVLEENRAIVDAMGITEPHRVVAIDASRPLRMAGSVWRAWLKLQRIGIDTCIDMDFFSRFAPVFAYLVCRGNRVGFHRYTSEGLWRGNLLTQRVAYSPHIHTSAAFLALVLALFADAQADVQFKGAIDPESLRPPRYRPPDESVRSLRAKLSRAGLERNEPAPLVIVNPNSSALFPLRRWPLERFAELSKRLLDARDDIRIVITGTRSEAQDAQSIVEHVRSPRCVALAGETTFPELLALYSMSSVMITNDSGPAHFAAMLELPTVVLFGPETPQLYAPLGRSAQVLYAGFACSPCVSVYNQKRSPCGRSLCLEAIPVGRVLEAALGALRTTEPREAPL